MNEASVPENDQKQALVFPEKIRKQLCLFFLANQESKEKS